MKNNGAPRRPLRVVRIIDRLNIGGPAKHVTWLTAGLDATEFETTLIAGVVTEHEGDMSGFARAADVKPLVIEELSRELSWRDVLVIARLFLLLLRLRPDIIHTHKAKAGAAGRVAALLYRWLTPSALWLRPRRCRVVHTFHGHIFHSYYGALKTWLFLTIERVLARVATDCIIVISEQQRREISEHFRVGQPAQFRVIPLGIACDEAEQTARGQSLRTAGGLTTDDWAVAVVGRLCAVKHHALLLQAAAHLFEREAGLRERLRFFIIGDGELRAELEMRARALQIAERVVFTGFRDDMAVLYADFDLVALTSLNEGTPLTLIEALNSGRAVVATEVGGVVDILGERRERLDGCTVWEHGVTAPSRDTEAFARALLYLLERPELRRAMGERGRAFVRARLSRERLLGDIAKLYRELAAAN